MVVDTAGISHVFVRLWWKQKTRQILTEKIAQLNAAIDDVSAQLHANDVPNGSAVNPGEIEASIWRNIEDEIVM